MAKFQLLTCNVALGGDILNVVARHAFVPVTFPELLILKYLHGESSITEIFDCGYTERDEVDEFKRLMETYGSVTVKEKMFPGAGTRLPQGDNRYQPRLVGTKVNPGGGPTPVPQTIDAPLPDATVSLAAPDVVRPSYDTGAADGYVPVAVETPAAAPAPVASRRPIPVADAS